MEFEQIIEQPFSDPALLQTALTHSSYANQHKNMEYNEKLEFLGDAVLQLAITEYIYRNFPQKTEGELTKLRALIVCEASLHQVAMDWNLGSYIRMSKGEELTGGRERAALLADGVEAVIAAVYLDQGMETAKKFVVKSFMEIIDMADRNEIVLDYKTSLQEILQENGEIDIRYELIRYEGPPHRRKFYSKVVIDSITMGKGEGFSKKESEQLAAKDALGKYVKAEDTHE
ncbi:ribonuclease III [Proteiniclasticum sp. SCR006]|uniref:Ribonuclease 3 n=1 Tax=Proteiniclasticum aestuarii TaxID=2817862 RepID=A0A939H3W9_9CLOT|nr:ribonuclease III [Proteiniclasticum aestuarii]MBO1263702.1 ribonuclease III [Proteiniclasticum aestuarii]